MYAELCKKQCDDEVIGLMLMIMTMMAAVLGKVTGLSTFYS